ncbi:ubiquitin carboxyl-terminal hydrolase 36/42 [Pancytospora epiphaga]|nr:ubiquitin carboxyl-terminal hydrolase 36/42 [Pancytospora epiphaga]
MKNKGNTCFFNATMQCLLSLPKFISYMKHKEFNARTQPISAALRDFIYDYQNYKIFDPQEFIRIIRGKIKLFDGRQQDAHCFLGALLNILTDEQEKDDRSLHDMFSIKHEDLIDCTVCGYRNVVEVDASAQCLDISSSVRESLKKYLTDDAHIDSRSSWVCPDCKDSTGLRIRHRIIHSSEYVIILLNRFFDIYRKNHSHIAIDENIKLGNQRYESAGVVCHIGSLQGGHYFSKGRRNGTWYEFNDSSVSKSQSSVESDQPYILFYAASE